MNTVLELRLAEARRMAAAAQAAARVAGHAVSVAVCDAAGRAILFERGDGALGITVDLAPAKARTAALLGVPSSRMEAALNSGYSALATLPGCVPLGGALAIHAKGRVVGAIAVSGAPTAAEDEVLAQAGLAALERPD